MKDDRGPRPHEESSCLSLSQAERTDQICLQFEAEWKAGQLDKKGMAGAPGFDDFLARAPRAEWPDVLRELLVLDVHYRRLLGEMPALEQYRADYPALDFDPLAEVFATALHCVPTSVTEATIQCSPSDSPTSRGVLPRSRRLGDYELLAEIARGGMGVVYKARQVSLNRIVAVKMILAGNLATQADRDRFHSEAEAAALLDHPNILPVFEVGEHEGQHYFSMGYIDGQSLGTRLADGPLSPKEAAELVATVADAVEYAHRHGVIHRDIKPSNILIDRHGRPRVTDFGLAKRLDGASDLTATGQVLGTPSYMAPEQAAGQIGIGPAADVYALGALLYAALAGRPPFQAATPLETLQQVLQHEPVALGQLNPGVPRDLETIILKCLEKPVPRRYATAQALAEDLRRFLAGRPILARPVGRWEHAWRWCRRQPAVAGLIVAVALTLIAGILVSSLFAVDSYRQAKRARENETQARNETTRADENLRRAQGAEAAARHDLAGALLAQARLASKSHLPGQRFETLEAIGKVRQIEGPSRKLADESVAALCLPDLVVAEHWPGAPQGCYAVAFTPLLDIYARCDVDGNISVRRVAGDREIAAFHTGHRVGNYRGLEFSPDGRYLRATTYNETAGSRLFRIDVTPATIVLDDRHIALAFSPDSRRFAARYRENEYRLCELPSGKELKRFKFPGVIDDLAYIYWNPRKPQIAITRRAGWRIADLDSGKQEAECLVPATIGISAWHPDGRHLAIGVNKPPGVEIYDTVTRRIVARHCIGIQKQGVVPTFNHAGDLLVTSDWTGIRRLWDPASGAELLHMAANDTSFFVVSPDDRRAAVNIEVPDVQTLRIARGAERTLAAAPTKDGQANDYGDRIAPSPDGRILAISSSAGVSLVDSQSGLELAVLPDRDPVRYDNTGALLTSGSNGFERWPMQSQSQGRIVHVNGPQSLFNKVSTYADSAAVSEDGSVVALASAFSNAGAVVMHQAKAGGEVRRVLTGPQDDVRHCAVSPDGKWVASGSFWPAPERLANVRVWDAASGQPVKTLTVGEKVWVWFSPRGRWLATLSHADGECRLWRSETWEAGPRFPRAVDVAFSADDRMLAVGDKAGRIRLCETESGREFAILPATAGTPVYPRCFSPDGTRLYAKVEWDTTVHVWDLRRIRDGLQELGLDQGWPEFPARQLDDDAPPPIVEMEPGAAPP